LVSNLVFVVQRFPGFGGAEEYVFQLVRGLTERGIDCTILTSDLDSREPIGLPDKVKLVRFPVLFKVGEYAFWRGLFSTVLNLKTDVIHLNTYGYFHSDVISVLHRYKKFNVVLTSHGFHGLDGFFRRQESFASLKSRFRFAVHPFYDLTLGRIEIASADALVAISSHDVETYKWLGADNCKIFEVPLGVRDVFFKSGNTNLQEGLQQKFGNGPVILSVGELSSVKGKDIPLRALSCLVKDYPNAKLVYVGKDGGLYRHLKVLTQQFGLEKNVIFEGYIPLENLVDYYKVADVLVHTSYAEGLSTVILEAMAAGLPVISTPAGGNGQLLQKSQGGYVVPFNDPESVCASIKKVLNSGLLMTTLGSNGYSFVDKNHRWSGLISKYEKIYNKVAL
jgi:glycosyltransferase involved in cell wall biosynthesis